MLYCCTDKDKARIFEYIGNDFKNCLYAYADLKKYSINEPFINVWLDLGEDDSIRGFIFSYHTGIHLFSKDLNFDFDAVVDKVKTLKPTMINGRIDILEKLLPFFPEYEHEFGHVFRHTWKNFNIKENIEPAKESDFHQMAELLCSDYGTGASYTVERLEQQLLERYKDGFGRYYILRKDNQIAALANTGAEVEDFAVITYVIVDEHFRRRGFASEITSYLCRELIEEGKEVYLVCYEDRAKTMYENIGFQICSDWGKIFVEQ